MTYVAFDLFDFSTGNDDVLRHVQHQLSLGRILFLAFRTNVVPLFFGSVRIMFEIVYFQQRLGFEAYVANFAFKKAENLWILFMFLL